MVIGVIFFSRFSFFMVKTGIDYRFGGVGVTVAWDSLRDIFSIDFEMFVRCAMVYIVIVISILWF